MKGASVVNSTAPSYPSSSKKAKDWDKLEVELKKEEKEENFRRVESRYGSFTRSFTLPQTVDSEKVEANYDKGVLKVQLAKKQEAKPKQIKVNVGSEKTLEAKGPSKAA